MKIIEYYIQWVLIYVTIYQVIFDQFIVSSSKNTLQGTIDEPVRNHYCYFAIIYFNLDCRCFI